MSDLLKSLNNLKDKINEIESNNFGKNSQTNDEKQEVVVDNSSIIAENIKLLKEIQSQKLVINVGGQEYSFSMRTLKNTFSSNIFENKQEKNIFYDGSPDLFNFIARIIRDVQKEFSADSYVLKLQETDDEVIIKEMLKEIFPSFEEDLLPKFKFEREIVVRTNVEQQQQEENNNQNANYNNNYNNNNAAYNNYY